jgi:hypothetical protein
VTEPSDTDWAYAAAFVDGEGCIAIPRGFVASRDKYMYSVAVVVEAMHSPRQINRERSVTA